MSFWSRALAILWKDLLYELRNRDTATSVVVFALLVVVVFNFTSEPGGEVFQSIAPGVLWVAFSFAGVLSLNRSFVMEKEKGCLEGLMLCPMGREVVYVGKMMGSFAFMFIVEIIILPIFSVLYNLPIVLPQLFLISALATVGFAAVGTLFSAVSVHTRAREIMLPLLFFPVVSPVIIAAVKASGLALAGQPWGAFSSWLQIIVAFDIIFFVVSFIVFEYILEE